MTGEEWEAICDIMEGKSIDAKEFEKVSQVKAYIPKSFEKAMGMAGMKKRAKAFANYKG